MRGPTAANSPRFAPKLPAADFHAESSNAPAVQARRFASPATGSLPSSR
jgi:hypothetical protein